MYVFIRSCIALTRGVVKIIQTDPDSFFSSRSGTLSSTAAPTYHYLALSSLSYPFALCLVLSFLLLSLSRRPSLRLTFSLLCVSVALSSHCPDAKFEIKPVLDLAPDDLVAFVNWPRGRSDLCVRFAHASLAITELERSGQRMRPVEDTY